MPDQLPAHPIDAVLVRESGRWVLRMERQFRHSPDRIWAALTHADQIRRWAPYVPDRDLDRLGEVALPQSQGGEPAEGPAEPGRVVEIVPSRLLVMLWGDHQLRFELTPTTDGVRLVLLHIFDEAAEAPDYASGWHLCLNVVMAQLDGKDVPSAAGEGARAHGWERIREQYARQFETQALA